MAQPRPTVSDADAPASDGLFLVIDQGGTATRAAVLDQDGRTCCMARRELATLRGDDGEVTHDPVALLADVDELLQEVASTLGDSVRAVRAAGLSCQRASVVAWDRSGLAPLSPVLSWQDTRARGLLAQAALPVEQVLAQTGMFPTAFHGASKLQWLARPLSAEGRCDWMLGPLACFLVAHLTGSPVCTPGFAQRTLLYDWRSGDWDARMLQRFGLGTEWLPPIRPDRADHGVLQLGGHGVPLRLIAGDQNLLPCAIDLPAGQGLLNLGTGAFLLMRAQQGRPVPRVQATLLPGDGLQAEFVIEATVHGAAAAFDWLAAQPWMAGDLPWSALDMESTEDPFFCNTVGGLGSPLWRGSVEPCFSQDRPSPDAAMRAVADSLAGLIRLNVDALRAAGEPLDALLVSGGLSRQRGLLQRIADVLGLSLAVGEEHEFSILGAWHLLSGVPPAAPAMAACIRPGPAQASAQARHVRWAAWLENRLAD